MSITNRELLFSSRPLIIFSGVTFIAVSFLYGITVGIRHNGLAHASRTVTANTSGVVPANGTRVVALLGDSASVRYSGSPEGLEMNGLPAESLSFSSTASVKEVLAGFQRTLFRAGYSTNGLAKNRRGSLVAWNFQDGSRILINAQRTPPNLTGPRVSGTIVAIYPGSGFRSGSPGIIPGFPLFNGGKGGTVVSSRGEAGRVYSTTYTNPGSVEQSVDFYESTLSASGWTVVEKTLSENEATGSLHLVREREEAALLFSAVGPSPQQKNLSPAAQVLITVAPRGSLW